MQTECAPPPWCGELIARNATHGNGGSGHLQKAYTYEPHANTHTQYTHNTPEAARADASEHPRAPASARAAPGNPTDPELTSSHDHDAKAVNRRDNADLDQGRRYVEEDHQHPEVLIGPLVLDERRHGDAPHKVEYDL